MKLSKPNLSLITASVGLDLPAQSVFDLPEKVLQFGTGVLLRALPDYYIDKANKAGLFNGRIVVVKSTMQGSADAFTEQDGLYTVSVKGYDSDEVIDKYVLNASISRVIAANDAWQDVLACAANPGLQVIISNTTEAGLVLVQDDIAALPPVSFPGKLLAFLYKRYQVFNGAADAGMVILPTELLTQNGTILKGILLALADQNIMDDGFKLWLIQANDFCNTLVDCIVPGSLSAAEKTVAAAQLGYTDDLIIMSEVYRLWAIEIQSERARKKLSFAAADESVVITGDIEKFKELKLRLLNGAHTFCCGFAVLKGFETVKEAMADKAFYSFISSLMFDELLPSVVSATIADEEANAFAVNVLNRFRNPFIEHKWLSITLQYTTKMRLRNIASIQQYYKRKGTVPLFMAKGLAAYILFMKSETDSEGKYVGNWAGRKYMLQDQHAAQLHEKWQQQKGLQMVKNILADTSLWTISLADLPGFTKAVFTELQALQTTEHDSSNF